MTTTLTRTGRLMQGGGGQGSRRSGGNTGSSGSTGTKRKRVVRRQEESEPSDSEDLELEIIGDDDAGQNKGAGGVGSVSTAKRGKAATVSSEPASKESKVASSSPSGAFTQQGDVFDFPDADDGRPLQRSRPSLTIVRKSPTQLGGGRGLRRPQQQHGKSKGQGAGKGGGGGKKQAKGTDDHEPMGEGQKSLTAFYTKAPPSTSSSMHVVDAGKVDDDDDALLEDPQDIVRRTSEALVEGKMYGSNSGGGGVGQRLAPAAGEPASSSTASKPSPFTVVSQPTADRFSVFKVLPTDWGMDAEEEERETSSGGPLATKRSRRSSSSNWHPLYRPEDVIEEVVERRRLSKSGSRPTSASSSTSVQGRQSRSNDSNDSATPPTPAIGGAASAPATGPMPNFVMNLQEGDDEEDGQDAVRQ